MQIVRAGLLRRASRHVDRPEVGELAVLARLDDIGVVPLLLALLLVVRLLIGADDGERRAVRRPRQIAETAAQIAQPPRLAAAHGQEVDVLLVLLIAVGEEGDRLPIRRPAGRRILARPARQLARQHRTVRRHEPEMRVPHRAILGSVRQHIRNAPPIRADLRIPRQRERDNLLNRERCAISHGILLTGLGPQRHKEREENDRSLFYIR